jgi:CsoR family transcriptional regulator, copper-sensing transcriptional repressor
LFWSPVIPVFMGDDDRDNVADIAEGHREHARIDDEPLVGDPENHARVLVFRQLHGSSLFGSALVRDPAKNTPRGYSVVMIDELKKRALHRSRILEGQMRGLEKMIESEEYCMDIITQSLAIQKSLRSLNKLLVENHLRTHVSDMFAEGGDQQGRAIDELLRVYELKNRDND